MTQLADTSDPEGDARMTGEEEEHDFFWLVSAILVGFELALDES